MLANGGQRDVALFLLISQKEELYLCGISPGLFPVIFLQNLPTGLLSGLALDNSTNLVEDIMCSPLPSKHHYL